MHITPNIPKIVSCSSDSGTETCTLVDVNGVEYVMQAPDTSTFNLWVTVLDNYVNGLT